MSNNKSIDTSLKYKIKRQTLTTKLNIKMAIVKLC